MKLRLEPRKTSGGAPYYVFVVAGLELYGYGPDDLGYPDEPVLVEQYLRDRAPELQHTLQHGRLEVDLPLADLGPDLVRPLERELSSRTGSVFAMLVTPSSTFSRKTGLGRSRREESWS